MNADPDGVRVDKTMALTLSDFQRGLARLFPGFEYAPTQRDFAVALAGGRIMLGFEDLPSERFGGLLVMPMARVTLVFAGLDEAARADFLARFDRTFQRGGG